MGTVRELTWATARVVLVAAVVLVLVMAMPAGAKGPPTQHSGSGTGFITDIEHGPENQLGNSGNFRQTRTLTGQVTGVLAGTFEQTVTGVVRPRRNFVTLHGTLTFSGTIDGCGEVEDVVLGVTGRGQATPPITEAKVRVIDTPSDLHLTGQGTVSQNGLDLTYDVQYRCR